MSLEAPTMREALNNGVLQQRVDMDRELSLGDILGRLIAGTPADEVGVAPAANAITLAAAPSAVLNVVSTAGAGFLGRLALKIGAPGSVDPAPGEVVWDGKGSSVLRFNAADAYTAVSIWYVNADGSDTLSLLERRLGQAD